MKLIDWLAIIACILIGSIGYVFFDPTAHAVFIAEMNKPATIKDVLIWATLIRFIFW